MAVTVGQLIDRAQAVSDKRSDASIQSADWLVYVNWGVKSLYKFLVSLDPGAFFAQSNFSLTSAPTGAAKDLTGVTWTDIFGTPLTSVGRFQALHGLDKDPDLPQRLTIPRRNFRERNTAAIGWWQPTTLAVDLRYDMRSRVLVVSPFERAAGNYRAYARLGPYLFASTSDEIPLDPTLEDASDEFIVDIAARRALNIEESDGSFNSGRLQEIKQELTEEHQRDNGEPSVIADVEADDVASYRGY